MKALNKEKLIKIIEAYFRDGDVIFEYDLKPVWNQLADDYFLENNRWTLLKKG